MCSANILCTGADVNNAWMVIDELKYLQGTVGILICISLICSPLMVVESQESVISLPLYIISPTCKSLNTPSSFAK